MMGKRFRQYVTGSAGKARILILAALLLGGCVYSAHSDIVIKRDNVAPQEMIVEAEQLNKRLELRYDGCFASHRATMEKTVEQQQLRLFYRVSNSNVELEVKIEPLQGLVTVTFDEWMEPVFSDFGRRCYTHLLNELENIYGKDYLLVVESCKAGNCLGKR
ncbi:MAG: hypothetical protein A2V90_02085 [Gammaproteobacteria bacterium RBG_16_57_12]|nr:MAG: hypothetical protein A2V90_02085 [Gammaproteobacteria bacterium RBG_16_57_12]